MHQTIALPKLCTERSIQLVWYAVLQCAWVCIICPITTNIIISARVSKFAQIFNILCKAKSAKHCKRMVGHYLCLNKWKVQFWHNNRVESVVGFNILGISWLQTKDIPWSRGACQEFLLAGSCRNAGDKNLNNVRLSWIIPLLSVF